jgi:AraC-like DNA-binding protein
MTETTSNHAKTTDLNAFHDVFSDVLSALAVSGNLLINETYAPPWRVLVPSAERFHALMGLERGARVVAFHYVKRGCVEVKPEGSEPVLAVAGELVIGFGGAAHELAQGAAGTAVNAEALLSGVANPFRPDAGSLTVSTELVCGMFIVRHTELNPLFASLPPLLHLPTTDRSSNLVVLLNWLDQEVGRHRQGSTFVIGRLLELLCVESLRGFLETAVPGGWMAGLKDPVVGRTIALMHAKPGENWSVPRLAQHVMMSPSRLAARFTAALQDSPMAYLTKWRMNMAGRMLKESRLSVEQIASQVGYENVAAFTRSFKRHLGVTPTVWRDFQD